MQLRSLVTGFAVAAVLSFGAQAQSVASSNPAEVKAGTYTLETSHARVLFAVDHMGFSTWYGDFYGATGELALDPAKLADAKLSVTIPVASVATHNAVLDGELKSADWFDAEKFPTITFTSTKVTVTSATTAKVEGNLSFHGVTKPVTLDAKFKASGTNPMSKAVTIGFEVSGKLKRSDFGVGKYVPLVGDEVSLIISAPFEKK